jgi:hypothetical protein
VISQSPALFEETAIDLPRCNIDMTLRNQVVCFVE